MSMYGDLRKTESLPLNSVVKSTKPCLGSRSSLKIMYHCAPDEVIFKVPGSLRIHPSLWSKEDVIHWLRWAEEEYSLKKTDDMKFAMNGRGLCILTKNDFKNRCPSSGDVLYELLSCIMTRRKSLVNHPIFRQPMRQAGHQKSHTSISTTKTRTAASQTSNDSTTQSAVMDTNQDGPLNLSNKIHSNQEKVPKLTMGNSNIQIKEHVPA